MKNQNEKILETNMKLREGLEEQGLELSDRLFRLNYSIEKNLEEKMAHLENLTL